jgi:pimeloyl-ACP methyl ester carboxylesterase
MALRWPERVKHLGLLHSLGGDVTFTGTFAVMRAFFPLARIAPPVMLRRLARRELQRWYVDPVRAQLSIDRFLRALGPTGSMPAILQHLVGLTPAAIRDIDAAIAGLDLPVAVVAASRDPAVPRWVAERLMAMIPNATLDFVEQVRHFSPEEAPERVAGVIERLVAR